MKPESAGTRSPYQEEMDQVRLSEQKADSTLQLMLEENRKLQEQDAGKTSPSRLRTWLVPALCAAAACLALVFVLGRPNTPGTVTFSNASIPLTSISGPAPDQAIRAEAPEESVIGPLLSSWNTTEVTDEFLLLEKDGHRMYAMIFRSDSEAIQDMKALPASGDPAVRFIRDPDLGALGALFEKGQSYILLFSRDLEESEFIRTVREAAGS